jgi:hypothetical protein
MAMTRILKLVVVINNLGIEGVAALIPETDSPLIVDAQAPETLAIAMQRFQPIARRHTKINDADRGVYRYQPLQRPLLDICRKPARSFASEDPRSLLAGKGADHVSTLTCPVINVKSYARHRGMTAMPPACRRHEHDISEGAEVRIGYLTRVCSYRRKP